MEQSFDIDLLASEVLAYLLKHYPLKPRKGVRWCSKVTKPSIRWAYLNKNTFGQCPSDNRSLVLQLNYNIAYTKEELIDTVAHEYRHMMQDYRLYAWYSNREKTGYWNHPLERDARSFAEQVLAEFTEVE